MKKRCPKLKELLSTSRPLVLPQVDGNVSSRDTTLPPDENSPEAKKVNPDDPGHDLPASEYRKMATSLFFRGGG
jgi:hypothetical protein